MIRLGVLPLAAVAPALKYWLGLSPIWVFLAGIAGVAVMADWLRVATDQLARRSGPAIGGLLTVSLGSVAELLLAGFVLASGHAAIVQAQITGSIMATSLLGVGLAVVIGGLRRERQRFRRERAGLLSSLLMLVLIALLLPAIADFTGRAVLHQPHPRSAEENLSLAVSAVLLLLYGGNMIYTLVTHRDVFASGEEDAGGDPWPAWQSLLVLAAVTAGAAGESGIVADALQAAAQALGIGALFLGVVVLALVGTISDLFAAVWFAHQDRMGLVMSICIGSAIQMALVVAPVLVIASLFIGHPMTLVFRNPLELFAIAGTAFIVNAIAGDGETTWFEGVLLIGVYALFATAFYFD